jgi:signal transduction histidine kinase
VATPNDGDIALSVRIETQEHEPGYALLQIADSGEGIPPEDLPRVFSRLYRSDNPGIQGVGDNGVGLTIVKTLVEAHGGRIWVDSDPGNGATYSVLLPLNAEKEAGGRL